MDDTWQLLAEALESGDAAVARETFLQERQACIACHVAEGFEFVNSTAMFEETAAFPATDPTAVASQARYGGPARLS